METLSWGEILLRLAIQFTPVWIALALTFALSIAFKRRLGLYGKLFDNWIGMIGFAIVMFWVYTSVFAGLFDWIATHDPLSTASGMKNKVPCAGPETAITPITCWAATRWRAMSSLAWCRGPGW